MFDISTISDVQSADIEIKDPVSGTPLGAIFTIAGSEHPKRKALDFARQRKQRASFQKAGKMVFTDPVEEALENIEYLASCTLGWKGIGQGGVAIPFSTDAAMKLYGDEKSGWLVAQLYTAMGERDRFINSSVLS